MTTLSIPLNSRKYPGLFALVDEEDYQRISQFRWCVAKRGRAYYAQRKATHLGNGRGTLLMHREILAAPPGVDVDHVNGDGLNNTRENIRCCSRAENAQHQLRPRSNKTSKYRGVYFTSRGEKWIGIIRRNGKGYHLGRHTEEEAAARAYDEAAKRLFGEYAVLNFPD